MRPGPRRLGSNQPQPSSTFRAASTQFEKDCPPSVVRHRAVADSGPTRRCTERRASGCRNAAVVGGTGNSAALGLPVRLTRGALTECVANLHVSQHLSEWQTESPASRRRRSSPSAASKVPLDARFPERNTPSTPRTSTALPREIQSGPTCLMRPPCELRISRKRSCGAGRRRHRRHSTRPFFYG
jgi:hypothetical protein